MTALTLLLAATLAAVPPAERVHRGQTPTEVRALVGPPSRIARQILFRRHLEQWVYDDPPLRVEFDCPRGEEPLVRAVIRGRVLP